MEITFKMITRILIYMHIFTYMYIHIYVIALNFLGCSFSDVDLKVTKGKMVDCRGQNLTELPIAVRQVNAPIYRLENNPFLQLNRDSLVSLTDLQYISLPTNQKLLDGIFRGNRELKSIVLSGQTELETSRVFKNLSSVVTLVGLEVESIPTGLLSPLNSLEQLNITVTGTRLPDDFLRSNKYMRNLSLAGPQLKSLPAGMFKSMERFQSIYLNTPNASLGCYLASQGLQLLQSFKVVAALSLDSCIFSKSAPVQADLRHVHIANTGLICGGFSSNYVVTEFTVRHTNISTLAQDCLPPSMLVLSLDMTHNWIRNISPDALSHMKFLSVLNLSYNQIRYSTYKIDSSAFYIVLIKPLLILPGAVAKIK